MSEVYSAILTATVLPEGCTDPISWTSSDNTVATVTPIPNTNTATVTALKAGTCNITVTCGDYSDVCAVTVSAGGPTPITELNLGDTYYINTGYTPTANTKVVSLLSTHKGNSWSTPFGSSDFFKCIWTNSANQIRFEYKGKYGLLKDIPTTLTDVTITCDGKGHTFSIDDTSIGVATTGTTSPLGPILIGTGLSSAGAIEIPPTGTYTKIKTFKIYEDDVLVMDFYPTEVDGVEGLYDTIGKQFYGKIELVSPVTDLLNIASTISLINGSPTIEAGQRITPSSGYSHTIVNTSEPSGVITTTNTNASTNTFNITPITLGSTVITSLVDGVSSNTSVNVVSSYNELDNIMTTRKHLLSPNGSNWQLVYSGSGYTKVFKILPYTSYKLTVTKQDGSGKFFVMQSSILAIRPWIGAGTSLINTSDRQSSYDITTGSTGDYLYVSSVANEMDTLVVTKN